MRDDTVAPARQRPARGIEWPTAALALVIYGGWLTVTYWHDQIPLWALVPVGGLLVTWHSSLQHELIHGHFTPWQRVNRLIGLPPLTLWLPFDRYRASHLRHHRDNRLTDPLDDPETRYWTAEQWAGLGVAGRLMVRAQLTLPGRLIIGPFWTIGRYLHAETRAILRGGAETAEVWLWHGPALIAVAAWVTLVAGMDIGLYIIAFVLPGTSFMLLRSFAEHRAAEAVGERTAVVDDTGPIALLFLFNNLHAVHHAHPGLAWYRLPGRWRATRDAVLAANGGLYYRGYGDVLNRFLWRRHDAPVHPLGRAP